MADILVPMIAVPLILFMIFVAPIWVIMHYRSKRKLSQGLSETELQDLQQLARQAEHMRERIKTLESILDADAPTWRERK
ncbi:envelope stress response membrane protein PspB [Pseudidiomarina terrestris]|uniref:Envelope stress response membrane protein PspB n=1 Tax=Pseudidiomarina terrestris TaxID=2820060 RepID=A0AAW7QXY8_9GAMM|nr:MULTISPECIES: envelope stress response membrane protein PspB [unclassified Pseudidiomarina]MDN7123617.1 envelope stress response membrane protein PspB [Pseudidiomarina sp. 1APP75-32.1]MDN7126593.1 envelope stress response membrane protein PspB [Pseudidiomarina sp. 1APR75-33.1]MDN7128659.1 envelope stress response membrane protein PspB [Pseudidiomarina sp. 1APR75-15]MDN7135082.1 envelope stress response membrane protein PspB [Pseudidiomarina sp. 1ASP75-5]MDN7137753.1 envelope stress response